MGSCWFSLVSIAMGLWGNSVDLGILIPVFTYTRRRQRPKSGCSLRAMGCGVLPASFGSVVGFFAQFAWSKVWLDSHV